jgi:hypothetical protein
MRFKTRAPKNKMGKTNTTNASTNWVPTEFKQTDLSKALADGLIADGDQVIFPSTERIPKPPSSFQMMFLAFLLRGLSFPAHEFLCGLLFVYGVQLHQLTPNSILHIAYFISLRVILGDRTPLSSLEISLSPPSQCCFIKKARAGRGCCFCPRGVSVLGIFHGCLCARLEEEVVLLKRPESLSL